MIARNFKIQLERLGYSQGSVQMLPSCLLEFMEFTDKSINEVQSQDVVAYHQYLQERPNKRSIGGLSEKYISHHIYALKVFFAWQEDSGYINHNPMNGFDFKTPEIKQREVLTQSEIRQLYNATETYREKAILSLFYGCGLRRSEGAKLNLKDIDFKNDLLYVRTGKGGKRRVVPMSEKVKQHLENYAQKERVRETKEAAFMINRIGKRMTGNTFNNCLKTLLHKAGIDKNISLHHLRHSIATHLLESGLSVDYVREFLGHKHLESTQIYTHVDAYKLHEL